MPWLPVPLAPLALAFATGVALAPLAPERAIWWAWGLSLIAAAVLSASGRCGLAALPLLLATGVLGALRATPPPMPLHHVARLCLPTTGRIEGRLVAEPTRWAPDRTRLLVEIERVGGLPGTGRIQATVYGEAPALTEGQRLAAEWRLREAVGFRNPGVFDYGAYLAREGIHVVGTGRADRVVPLDDPTPPWPVRVKRRALDVMREALPPTSAALLGGLLLGDRTTLPHDLADAFRRAGVYHVLAVSGFNVVLLASSVFLLASDITARTESELLRRRTPLAATVLKVAHHGARGSTTSEFLAAVRPLIAVISVGTRGTYGHPSPEVIARLVRAGATIYRTDRDGAVIFETDGRSLKVTTWASRRHDRYCLDPETIC